MNKNANQTAVDCWGDFPALPEDPAQSGQAHAEPEAPSRFKSLPALLRLTGAVVLIAAALTFMLQNWEDLSHLQRYFSFLGFTLALTAAGFVSWIALKDDKSARTFLAVCAAIIPIHFCQLGALLYSSFGAPLKSYPQWLTWQAAGGLSALLTTAVGLAALVPAAYIAFRVLARPHAKLLTLVYILTNAVLLIPTRSPDLIGLIALSMLPALCAFDSCCLKGQTAMKTTEGGFVRVMLLVPFVLLIGRTFQLYEISNLMHAALWATAAITLFVFVPQYAPRSGLSKRAQALSTVPAAVAWALVATELISKFDLDSTVGMALVTQPIALILAAMSLFAENHARRYLQAGALVSVLSAAHLLLISPSPSSALICVAIAITIGAYGYVTRSFHVCLAALPAFALGIYQNLHFAMQICEINPWVTLALIGTLTIFASAYVERNYALIVQRVRRLRADLKNWQ